MGKQQMDLCIVLRRGWSREDGESGKPAKPQEECRVSVEDHGTRHRRERNMRQRMQIGRLEDDRILEATDAAESCTPAPRSTFA